MDSLTPLDGLHVLDMQCVATVVAVLLHRSTDSLAALLNSNVTGCIAASLAGWLITLLIILKVFNLITSAD